MRQDDDARGERFDPGEFERRPAEAVEDASAASPNDGHDPELVLVNKAVLNEGVGEAARTVNKMSRPGSPLSLATSSATSPLRSLDLFHIRGSLSVVETTTLVMLLNLSAKSPVLEGHASPKPS